MRCRAGWCAERADHALAYDPLLATRLRDVLGDLAPLVEKRMMGGFVLMWRDHMLCGGTRWKDRPAQFLFRVGPTREAAALALPGAQRMEMAARRMAGFVALEADAADDATVAAMLALARAFVAELPDRRRPAARTRRRVPA